MAYVQIPKDLSNVKTKMAFNLTKRQLIGFTIAGLIGIPTYLKTRGLIGNDLAVILLIIITIPIFIIVFYEKDGLTCEQYLKYIYLYERYQPKERISKEKLIKIRKEQAEQNGKKSSPGKKKNTRKQASKKAKGNKKGSKRT